MKLNGILLLLAALATGCCGPDDSSSAEEDKAGDSPAAEKEDNAFEDANCLPEEERVPEHPPNECRYTINPLDGDCEYLFDGHNSAWLLANNRCCVWTCLR